MRFHEKRIFNPDFCPVPFSYAVRRPNHYPEGTVCLERSGDGGPAFTMTRVLRGPEVAPMSFKINAATNVMFEGDRYGSYAFSFLICKMVGYTSRT